MGQLTNQYVSSSYQGLLKMTDSTTGVTNILQTVQTGDGTDTPLQISKTQVNISGSLTINGGPISVDTGSFATTGSNQFNGDQSISGALNVSTSIDTPILQSTGNLSVWGEGGYVNVTGSIKTTGPIIWDSNAFNYSNVPSGALYFSTLSGGTLHLNDDGGEGDVFIGWGPNKTHIRGDVDVTGSLGVTNIKGTGSLLLQPNQSDARYLEIYNTSPTDTHITGSGGQIFIGDDVTYVKVDNYGSVKRIDIVADNLINVSGSMNVTGSIDITGDYLVNGVAFSGGTNGTSGTSGSDGSSGTSGGTGTSGTSGSDGSSGTSGSSGIGSSGTSGTSGTSPADLNRTGLITTGSLGTSQAISGSLTDFGGNLYIVQSGQTVPFNITGSGGGNVIMGYISGSAESSGYVQSDITGSIQITGSNNILTQGVVDNKIDYYGLKQFINGYSNVLGVPFYLGTGSLLTPTTYGNIIPFFPPVFYFTTSSLAQPTFYNNMMLSQATVTHNSGSVNINSNLFVNGLTSNANTRTLTLNAQVFNNIGIGPNLVLNHNSSSIVYQQNLGGLTINNNYSSSVSNAVNNIAINGNAFIGSTNSITVTGSNTAARRTIGQNLIAGRSNEVNSNYTTGTGGHLVATSIFGQNLIVSASNTSNTVGGSTFVGRYNATGSLQESSQDTVFVVGTGTSATTRRNALRIDSNNNSNFTGSVNISGSLQVNGVSPLIGTTGLITTGSAGGTQSITGSLIISGSLIITGSIYNRGNGNSINNLAYGEDALFKNSIVGGGGYNNTALGYNAMYNTTTGATNTAIGANAMLENVSGSGNVAIGDNALRVNKANNNLAIGSTSLFQNTTGTNNTAIGGGAMANNVSGSQNLAIGRSALSNVQSNNNTALGGEALSSLTIGLFNTAIGYQSMAGVTTGSLNTAFGNEAGQNIQGDNNIGIGYSSIKNATGARNIGIGNESLKSAGTDNIAIGHQSGFNETGSNNLYIGIKNYGSINQDRSGSLMWGTFNDTTANQTLQINAQTNIKGSLTVTGGINYSSGSNTTVGTVVLDGANPGTVTVSNSLVTANSIIFLTKQTLTNSHSVAVSSKGSSTFTITSTGNGDSDTVAYQIINPI